MRIFVQINLAGAIIVAIKIAKILLLLEHQNWAKRPVRPGSNRVRKLRGLRFFRQEIQFSEVFH